MKLTALGPRSPRRESIEGGEKTWSCQSRVAPAEGLLSGVSASPIADVRSGIDHVLDRS